MEIDTIAEQLFFTTVRVDRAGMVPNPLDVCAIMAVAITEDWPQPVATRQQPVVATEEQETY